jgi:AraC-like DNA-binding protein
VRVAFAHRKPDDIGEHQRIFRAPIVFGASGTELHVPQSVLDVPSPSRDDGLASLLDRYADALLASTPQDTSLASRMGSLIEQEIESPPSAEEVARRFNKSARSLHRALVSEGTTFRAVLERVRHARATRLLAEPTLAISEVAFLVGFSEVSSFHRAFKRWSGCTPAEFRQDSG